MRTYQSAIANDLEPDDPIVIDAEYQFSDADREYIDDQLRATQQAVADNVLNGIHTTWVMLDQDSLPVQAGHGICAAGTSPQYVTLATPTALSNAGSAMGVAMQAGSPGSMIRVAVAGLVPASVTSLAAVEGFARVNATTYFVEKVSSLGSSDYPLGAIAANGDLTLCPLPRDVAGGGGGGGNTLLFQSNGASVSGGPFATANVTGAGAANVGGVVTFASSPPATVQNVSHSGAPYTTTNVAATIVGCDTSGGPVTVTAGVTVPDHALVELGDDSATCASGHEINFQPQSGDQVPDLSHPGSYLTAGLPLVLNSPGASIRLRRSAAFNRWVPYS